MLSLAKHKKMVFMIVILAAFCLTLSFLLPIVRSQVNSFTLPCIINTTGNAWDGYIAFDLELQSTFMGVGGNNNYLVVMDTNGTVLAIRQSYTSYGAAWNIAPDTLMFLGEPQQGGATSAPTYSTHFWNLTSGITEDFPNVISEHDIQYDPVNNTFLTLQQYVQQVGNNQYLIDKIVQVDPFGNVIWTWNPYDHMPLSEASAFNETSVYNGQTVIDFSHSNTLDWQYNSSVIYLNQRNTNTFYKINQTNGDIIWACGEFGNFTLLDAKGVPLENDGLLPPSLWYHSHEIEEIAPDHFILFNNDYENNTNPNDCRSSMMEIALNETAMTATVVWSWEAPTSLWNLYAGGTVPLPNGDFLGDFGDPTHQVANNELANGTWNFNDTGAVFVEVNSTGQVVRTFTFPVGCYVYRVETLTNPTSIVFAQASIAKPTSTPIASLIPTAVPTRSPVSSTPTLTTPAPTDFSSPTPTSTRLTSAFVVSPWEEITLALFLSVTAAVVILATFNILGKRNRTRKNSIS